MNVIPEPLGIKQPLTSWHAVKINQSVKTTKMLTLATFLPRLFFFFYVFFFILLLLSWFLKNRQKVQTRRSLLQKINDQLYKWLASSKKFSILIMTINSFFFCCAKRFHQIISDKNGHFFFTYDHCFLIASSFIDIVLYFIVRAHTHIHTHTHTHTHLSMYIFFSVYVVIFISFFFFSLSLPLSLNIYRHTEKIT